MFLIVSIAFLPYLGKFRTILMGQYIIVVGKYTHRVSCARARARCEYSLSSILKAYLQG